MGVLILVTGLVFGGWWRWLPRPLGRLGRWSYAGLLGATQIVATELVLGEAGLLRLPLLLGGTLGVSGLVWGWGVWRGRGHSRSPVAPALRVPPLDWANGALLLLVELVSAWLLVATWLLPPRGADDLAYHLPAIFQMAQTGSLQVLPLQIRFQFALPLGGDLLYLWPVLFLQGDTTWVDGVQWLVALFGGGVMVALARSLGARGRDALFGGLLWLLVPVVMAQAASNYVESISAVAHLLLFYAAVRFWQTDARVHLCMAGLAAGFGLGVKYSMLVPLVSVQALLLGRLWCPPGGAEAGVRVRVRRVAEGSALFLLAAIPLPAYWLWRNARLTGYPLYPYSLELTGLQPVAGPPSSGPMNLPAGSALSRWIDEPGRVVQYLFEDPGLASLNGGFGLVFWGLGVPALLYATARAWQRRDWLRVLFWAQALPLLLTFLSQIDIARLRFNMRLLLPVAALGLVALAVLLRDLRVGAPRYVGLVRGAALLGALLGVVQLPASTLPVLQIQGAVEDYLQGRSTSPFVYYAQSEPDLAGLAPAFAAVDYLTQERGGWAVSLATEWGSFVTAPLFGSRLQNRVWNFSAAPASPPDALIFQVPTGMPRAEAWGQADPLFYPWPQSRITRAEAGEDARYQPVELSAPGVELYLRRDRLAEPAVAAALGEFRRRQKARAGGA